MFGGRSFGSTPITFIPNPCARCAICDPIPPTPITTKHSVPAVAPSGGHRTRVPSARGKLLLHLYRQRQSYSPRNFPPPAPLTNSIDSRTPMLRFFRQGDGNFELVNGMGRTRSD